MTRAEVDQAVALVVGQFRIARQQEENDRKQREVQQNRRDLYERRQSFFDDPRYSNMGIGKRNVIDNSDSTKRLPELRSRHLVLKLQRFLTPNALDAQTLFSRSSYYAKLTGLPLITLLGIRIEGSEKPDSNRKRVGQKVTAMALRDKSTKIDSKHR
ncbi:hypothetical protein PoB_001084000 [Plakobranchus ocellatus]|uniref:Uncharacterized protein n=1 Tax=Plakobranchus ocellatus TaxID=259542 RepID=A0AAV3YMK2_9GAST|nr:hypothetical protein PoB_001084000 [Plakobranchus ocellatus]